MRLVIIAKSIVTSQIVASLSSLGSPGSCKPDARPVVGVVFGDGRRLEARRHTPRFPILKGKIPGELGPVIRTSHRALEMLG